jgi:hypothetical protein
LDNRSPVASSFISSDKSDVDAAGTKFSGIRLKISEQNEPKSRVGVAFCLKISQRLGALKSCNAFFVTDGINRFFYAYSQVASLNAETALMPLSIEDGLSVSFLEG